jgi:hypothetical protein
MILMRKVTLMCIVMCSSINAAPTTEDTSTIMTTTLSSAFDNFHTTPFFDTRVNEVDGNSPNDELLSDITTTTTTTEEIPISTTESKFDKRFDGAGGDEDGFESWKKSLIHEVEKSEEAATTLSTPSLSSSTASQHPSISEHTRARIMHHYREIMRSQFLRTLLIMLSEVKKRQMQQDAQESQVVETSVPYHSAGSECECEIDDVSSSDDGKVIVFDESTGKYVYVDGKTLAAKIHAHHVSVIQMPK